MGKVMTIPFGSGRKTVGAPEAKELQAKIRLPQIERFTSDPTVIFVVLGFADRKGDAQKNLAISRQRAESAVSVLKTQCGVENIIHAVGMGGSELFDAGNLDKNRVVEVWAVLP
jgi:outer membrane protein OmpA-like peptidoglycan-associated protein